MPVLTGPIEPYGPIIPVRIMQSHAYAAAPKSRGRQPRAPIDIEAMIDTGASCTALDHAVVLHLELMHHGVYHIHTPSTGAAAESRDAFDATIVVGHEPEPHRNLVITLPVIDRDLAHGRGYQALIGRDVLRHCRFEYEGRFGLFALKFGADLTPAD